MTVQVDSVEALVRVSFSNDADPDFKGQAVFLLSDWQGWTVLQKGVRLALRYQEWLNNRNPVVPDPATLAAMRLADLKAAALQRWQLERDLNMTATVNPDGSVTVT